MANKQLQDRLDFWRGRLKRGDKVIECQVGAQAEHKMMMRQGEVKGVGRKFVTLTTDDRYHLQTLGHENMPFKLYPPDWTGREVWQHMGQDETPWPHAKDVVPKGMTKSRELPGLYEFPKAEAKDDPND